VPASFQLGVAAQELAFLVVKIRVAVEDRVVGEEEQVLALYMESVEVVGVWELTSFCYPRQNCSLKPEKQIGKITAIT
jgi:hypothetical protein